MTASWFKPEKLPMPSETDIKQQIKAYLRYRGWFVFHILQGVGAYKGISDLIALRQGRVLFIEVKTPRGKQSEEQIMFENAIRSSGGEYILARSVTDVAAASGELLH